jgi:hypothetical protein
MQSAIMLQEHTLRQPIENGSDVVGNLYTSVQHALDGCFAANLKHQTSVGIHCLQQTAMMAPDVAFIYYNSN